MELRLGTKRNDDGRSFHYLLEESQPLSKPLWGDDKIVFNGRAADISMDIAINGDIYLSVIGRHDGLATTDSVYIYKSTDGGVNWVEWSVLFASTQTFKQIEIMLLMDKLAALVNLHTFYFSIYLIMAGLE